jgi:hypothetical protein
MEDTPTYRSKQKTIKGLELIMLTVQQGNFMTPKQKQAHDILGRLCMRIGLEELAMQNAQASGV